MRSPAQNAELALLLEVTGTPKPGNVDRERDLEDLRFEHFMAGAVGAGPGLAAAADGSVAVGAAFERAVAGMGEQSAGNTQFGALLLLVPLVRAASAHDELTPDAVESVVEGTTVADAAGFYRAFDHVGVAVGDPPEDLGVPDVRRGGDAVPDLEAEGTTLYDVMSASAPGDGNAAEWTGGFERTFDAAERIANGRGPLPDRAARVFLWLLSREPDSLVRVEHGEKTAKSVMTRAQQARREDEAYVRAFAESLVEEGVNPGTTADITAAALFVALERHGVTV